jgi:hypothetical protein
LRAREHWHAGTESKFPQRRPQTGFSLNQRSRN